MEIAHLQSRKSMIWKLWSISTIRKSEICHELICPVVDGDHLPRIFGDCCVFVLDANHPPRAVQFVVYERRAATAGSIYHGLHKLFVAAAPVFDCACDLTLIDARLFFWLPRYLKVAGCRSSRSGPPCKVVQCRSSRSGPSYQFLKELCDARDIFYLTFFRFLYYLGRWGGRRREERGRRHWSDAGGRTRRAGAKGCRLRETRQHKDMCTADGCAGKLASGSERATLYGSSGYWTIQLWRPKLSNAIGYTILLRSTSSKAQSIWIPFISGAKPMDSLEIQFQIYWCSLLHTFPRIR